MFDQALLLSPALRFSRSFQLPLSLPKVRPFRNGRRRCRRKWGQNANPIAATLASVDSVISVVKMIALHHGGHREHREDLPIGDGSFLPLYASHALSLRSAESQRQILHPVHEVVGLCNASDQLERDIPGCPLVSLLRPMVEDRDSEVETKAAQDYAALRSSPELDEEDQGCFTTLFVQLLMQRFKRRNSQDIHAMIQDLPPVEETCAGRELIEKGIERGQRGAIHGFLEARFGTLPGNAIEELGRASGADRLASLQRTAALCASLDEFMAALRQD